MKNGTALYKVQIGVFKNRDNANSLAAQAKSKGFDTTIVQSGNLYRVQIGAFSQRSNADDLASKATSSGFDTLIISE